MKIIQSKSVVLAADTSDAANIDLQLLGISKQVSEGSPSATRCPPAFSNEASVLWTKLWKTEDFVKAVKARPEPSFQWKTALKLFMNECKATGVSPFASARNRVDNSNLIAFLSSARMRLKKFVDDTKFFEEFRVIRGTQERKYTTGFAQFSLKCSIRVKCPIKGILDLANHLSKMGFVREPNSTYKKIITPHVFLFVHAATTNKVTVWYEIDGCSGIFMGEKNRIPTKKQVGQLCDTMIWLPVIRTHRFKALGIHTLF